MPPLILHHGVLVPGDVRIAGHSIGSFVPLSRFVASLGYTPILTQVHPTASIAHRASQLKQTILQRLEHLNYTGKVIILAHSMGGLDARYMISRLGMDDRVEALVTISTPHRGSPYADWCLRHLNRFRALHALSYIGLDVGAATDLTTTACSRFNEQTPDAPTVRYLSIQAARPFREVSPLLYLPYKVIHDIEGENDGLVSLKSSPWGQVLETWPADHFHILNRRLVIERKNPTGDIRPYYERLLQTLAALTTL